MPLRRTEASLNLHRFGQDCSMQTDMPQKCPERLPLNQTTAKESETVTTLGLKRSAQAGRFRIVARKGAASAKKELASTSPGDTISFASQEPKALVKPDVSAKTVLLQHLHFLKDKLRNNQDPDIKETRFMPLLMKAENMLDPSLQLRFMSPIHDGETNYKTVLLRELINDIKHGGPTRWQGVLNDGHHGVAVSVKHSEEEPNNISIILLDSLKEMVCDSAFHMDDATAIANFLNAINEQSGLPPVRIHIAYLYSEMQLGRRGCNLFALIAAKEMAKSEAINQLHASGIEHLHLTNDVFHNAHVADFQQDAFKLLEPRFFKHSTSYKTIEQLLKVRPSLKDAIVNRKNQTLESRYKKHEIARAFKFDDPRRFSTSIEIKRIKLFERVLHTLGDELEQKPLAYFAAEQARGPRELMAVMKEPGADQIDFDSLMRAGFKNGW